MKVIQIVGYKNSGKTTFAKELITYLSTRGITVGSLKNHGHGGLPIGIEDTDSEQHRAAGSTIAGVIGEGRLQLSHAKRWEIDDILLVYEKLGTELLIIEGFKLLPFFKIVLLKNVDDIQLIEMLDNIKGVIKSNEIEIENFDGAIFQYDDTGKAAEWIFHCFEKGML